MLVASRTKNPLLQGLARLGSALLVRAAALLTKVVPLHIPGVQNIEADALSRPVTKASPTLELLESVILRHSQLRTCHVCLLPFELLTTIASVITSPRTVEKYKDVTTSLLTLAPTILSTGADVSSYTSTLLFPSTPRK